MKKYKQTITVEMGMADDGKGTFEAEIKFDPCLKGDDTEEAKNMCQTEQNPQIITGHVAKHVAFALKSMNQGE